MVGCLVRTTTQRMISPCLTSPAGIAFFTAQMITSPTCATFRLNLPLLLDPRSTLIHIACLAPVLSAMSRYVCCWIMAAASWHGVSTRADLWHGLTRATTSPRFGGLTRHHLLGRDLDGPLRGAFDDTEQAVMLGLAERPALGDFHQVALVGVVLFVVGVKHRPPLEVLAVLGMAGLVRHHNLDRLVALVGGDHASDRAELRSLGSLRL